MHRKDYEYRSLKQFFLIVMTSLFCLEQSQSFAKNISDKYTSRFIQAEGRKLFVNGTPIALKGINFSNRYAESISPEELLSSHHHSSEDFHRVADFGMNAVRFAFKGEWYEKNEKIFFQWLDQNIEWARQAGIYLILDLHVPIGGFWLDPTSKHVDFSIWSDPTVQNKNLNMWKAIAKRYRDETVIAAYDVLNEPVTSDQDGSQWKVLAQKLVDEIRTVDRNHLIVIGKLYGVEKSYATEGVESQFLVNDKNILYDFHYYAPIQFTHQYASWLVRPIQDGGSYPDEEILLPTGKQVYITSLTQEIPHSFGLSSHWQKFELKKIKLNNPKIKMGLPVLLVNGKTAGKVFFDNFEVHEYAGKKPPKTIISEPLSKLTVWDWWHWSRAESGGDGTFERVENDGVNDSHSLAVANIKGAGGYSGWSSDLQWFRVKQGNTYSMTGHLKTTDPKARAYFDIAFYGEPPSGGEKAFLPRNREYLQWEFMKHYQFGIDNNVPISVMEFGLTHECFNKGGEKWIEDILDIFLQHDVSFAYWDYHSNRMGVYYKESGKPPGNPNSKLIKAFRKKLSRR